MSMREEEMGMKAVLGNKEYLIDESQKKHYVDRGYDIRDEDNTVIAYGRGKTVPYEEYASVLKENSDLKEQFSMENEMWKESLSNENSAMKERLKDLSEENDALKGQVKCLSEENDALKGQIKDLAEANNILRQQASPENQMTEDTKAKSSAKSKKDDAAG